MADDAGNTTLPGNISTRPTVRPREKSPAGLLVGIVLLATAGGGGAAWFVIQHGQPETSKQPDAIEAPRYVIHLEGFTVNLADAEETHFLRVTMDLGIDHPLDAGAKEKIPTQFPVGRIRDAVLNVLTVCKADPLLTPAGKAALKASLLESLNRKVPELGVRDVYFTEFLVQR